MRDTIAPTTPVRKRLIFYGMLICLIAAVPLIALELFLRLPTKSAFVVETSNMLIPSDIPGLGYRLASNYVNGSLQTDQLGFRRRVHSEAPVTRSILLLGDSVAFAGGVPYEDSFASLVEDQLSQTLGKQVGVQNSGTPGYNSAQEMLLLKDLQKRIKPNLIILQFCMNDYLEPVALTANNSLDATSTAGGQISFSSILNRSRAIFFLKEKVKDLEKLYPEDFPPALHYIHYIHKRAGWQRAKEAILQIAETSKQMGAGFVLVIFPVEQQLRIGDRGPQDDLLAFANAHDIEVLDLYPGFARHWREHLFFDYSVEQHVVDKVHLSKKGHELAAGEIAAAILNAPILRSALE
jgi:lysophospholipase L1-like esterase